MTSRFDAVPVGNHPFALPRHTHVQEVYGSRDGIYCELHIAGMIAVELSMTRSIMMGTSDEPINNPFILSIVFIVVHEVVRLLQTEVQQVQEQLLGDGCMLFRGSSGQFHKLFRIFYGLAESAECPAEDGGQTR